MRGENGEEEKARQGHALCRLRRARRGLALRAFLLVVPCAVCVQVLTGRPFPLSEIAASKVPCGGPLSIAWPTVKAPRKARVPLSSRALDGVFKRLSPTS